MSAAAAAGCAVGTPAATATVPTDTAVAPASVVLRPTGKPGISPAGGAARIHVICTRLWPGVAACVLPAVGCARKEQSETGRPAPAPGPGGSTVICHEAGSLPHAFGSLRRSAAPRPAAWVGQGDWAAYATSSTT